jgi:sugar phosphate isomerase/epimerase
MDVAMRDAMVPEAGMPQFFQGVRALGVNAVEIEVARDLTTKHLRRPDGSAYSVDGGAAVGELTDRLERERIRPGALLLATDFSGPDPDDAVEWAVAVVAAAAGLGVPVVRIDPLALDRSIPSDRVLRNVIEAALRLTEHTGFTNVDVGMENHGPFANDPAFLDAVLSAAPDPRLGLTLDTGNFYWSGVPLDELYALIERYAPRVKHTHVKNINYPPEIANARRDVGAGYKEYCCALDEGNIDLARVVKILRNSGYDRDLCIENESLFKHPPEARADVLRRDVAAVRSAMAP